MAGVDWIKRDR